MFAGCHVVIVPDRDTTGEDAARITAARLKGVAASVRIATLPAELKAKDGDGVREVLARKDGEAMLRQYEKTGSSRYYVAPDIAMLSVDALGFRRGAGVPGRTR